jgi:hypothetical protein
MFAEVDSVWASIVALLTLRLPGLDLHIAGDTVHRLQAVTLEILVIKLLHSL